MDYLNYKAEDFAADESFIAYHLKTDADAVSFWETWGRNHPEKLDEIAAAENMIDILSVRLSAHEFETERDKMMQHIDSSRIISLNRPTRKIYWTVAASIALIMGISLVLLNRKNENNAISQHTDQQWNKLTVPNGRKSMMKLPDGSTIVLNGGSTLEYPKVFSDTIRELKLSGEAYFSVTHDAHRPFVVHTGQLDTRVLGTEFNVSAYRPEENVVVALVRGKVKVSADHKSDILTPGLKVHYDAQNGELTKSDFDPREQLAWKENRLVFKNADFQTVAEAIEHAYGYQLVDKNKNTGWHYTGSFQSDDVFTVVENICFSKNMQYTSDKKTIYLSPVK